MKFILCLMLGLLFTACNAGPSPARASVAVKSKDGESCLVDHQCKIIIQRFESPSGNEPIQTNTGANVFYRCIVSDQFYNMADLGDHVILDMNKCERINP